MFLPDWMIWAVPVAIGSRRSIRLALWCLVRAYEGIGCDLLQMSALAGWECGLSLSAAASAG